MKERGAHLCRANQSALLVVDIQERLLAAMLPEVRERVARNAGILLRAAALLGVPVMLTEQYPKGLGPTVDALVEHLAPSARRFEKTCFCCCDAPDLMDALRSLERRQIVLAGMEAHVCVLQSALGLLSEGYQVFVAGDASCSRSPENLRNAVGRMEQAGVIVTNTESVIFEWLGDSRHERFRTISALVR